MAEPILKIEHVSKNFDVGSGIVHALDDVSFDVYEGETIGIVGESGCGKSTLGKCVVKAHTPSDGKIMYKKDGEFLDFHRLSKEKTRETRKEVQMIFQDPNSSLDPRMTVYDILSEPLKANFPKMSKDEMKKIINDIAVKVGLNPSYLMRYPHAFSGGQRQRIGIARALVLNPRIIVCDEAVSALDVSVQAQIISLLKDVQESYGLTYLFISHDLSVVEYLSDHVAVMYLGRLVEFATTKELFYHPRHPYTEALLSAVLIADPTLEQEHIRLEGEVPSPIHPPQGCHFHERCRFCTEKCKTEVPPLFEITPGHKVRCHRAEELSLKGIQVKKEN